MQLYIYYYRITSKEAKNTIYCLFIHQLIWLMNDFESSIWDLQQRVLSIFANLIKHVKHIGQSMMAHAIQWFSSHI